MCPTERASIIVAGFAFFATVPGLAQEAPQLHVERTAHYQVSFEGAAHEARDLARCLEAAFEGFETFLGRSPKGRDEPHEVTVWSTQASWERGLTARGIAPPAWAQGKWFRRQDGAVYVLRQATPFLTRSSVLVGAFQQFHYSCLAKNRDLVRSWYVLGLAEHLALHRWDGTRLELGVVPLIAVNDPPGRALETFDASVTGLDRLTDGALRTRLSAWAWVSYLLSGKEPRVRKRFDKLALGKRGSMLTGNEFAGSLGDPAELALSVQLWLESVQIPWKVEQGEWEDRDGETIVGVSRLGTAFARLARPATWLRVEVEPQQRSTPGVLVDWNGPRDHVMLLVLTDRIRIVPIEQGARLPGLDVAIEPGPSHVVIVAAGLDGCRIEVDGGKSTWVKTHGGSFGLLARRGAARFRGIEWE